MSFMLHWILLGAIILIPLLFNEQARPLMAAPVPVESTPQTLELMDTAMIPAPYLAEWLGGAIATEPTSGQLLISAKGRRLLLAVNAVQATSTTEGMLTLERPVLDIAGTIYVPLRSVARAFGADAARDTDGLSILLTDPATNRTVNLPLRGRIFTVEGDLDADGNMERAYGAYLYFANHLNTWHDGRSTSNPNLPLVWVVKDLKTVWSRQAEGYELLQLFQGDLEGNGRSELWFTSLLPGADHVDYYFHALAWDGRTFRNIIADPNEHLHYMTNGGLLAWITQRPTQLILFNPIYGEIHAEGPVALQVATYAWDGQQFVLQASRQSQGVYNEDPIATLRGEFGIPVTDAAADRIRENLVAFQ